MSEPSQHATRPPDRRYVLISPCRDEAEYLARSVASVLGQSIIPVLWIIVDDGSTDATPELLSRLTSGHDFVRILSLADRGRRAVGGGVVEAFNAGLSSVDVDFDYVCKLDLDLILPPTYFEELIKWMEREPRLGSCSGKARFRDGQGRFHLEHIGDDVSVGGTKFYRRECLAEIGGFVSEVMWDGIDCHEARLRGWKVASSPRSDLIFEHLRPMGSSQAGIVRGRIRHGKGLHFLGASPLFALASAAYRLGQRPRILGSLAMLYAYFRSSALRTTRYGSREYQGFVRRYHRLCLLKGKRHAVAKVEAERASLWFSRHSIAPGADR